MAIKQILVKDVDGKTLYECSGDYEWALNVTESDPLYPKLTGLMSELSATLEQKIEEYERTKPKLEDDVYVVYDKNKTTIYSKMFESSVVADKNGVVRIGDWLIIVSLSEVVEDNITVMIYRKNGVIGKSKHVVCRYDDVLEVKMYVDSANEHFVEIEKLAPDVAPGVRDSIDFGGKPK